MQRVLHKRNRSFIIILSFWAFVGWYFLSSGSREEQTQDDAIGVKLPSVQPTNENLVSVPSVAIASNVLENLATPTSTRLLFKFPASSDGKDPDHSVRQRRDVVRKMMEHAWDGYVKYAWGENELRPIGKKSHYSSILGSGPLGGTIIDSLDTLLIMNMTEEYEAARAWIEKHFDLDVADEPLSLFEVNIRLLGGLLSAYALTTDELFLKHAIKLGERLLPAFGTSNGIPYSRVNLKTGRVSGMDPVLAEWGTLSLEFNYLADASGREQFRQPIRRIYDAINNAVSKDGIFPMRIVPRSKVAKKKKVKWSDLGHYTFGAGSDSFYEYLLKSWLQSGKTDEESAQLYLSATKGAQMHLVRRSSPSNLTYLADIVYNHEEHKMGHLACFAGGMFALGGKEFGIQSHLELGAELTRTCRKSYEKSPVQIGPEVFVFNDEKEAGPSGDESQRYYILRPEVVESYFILWRITHDPRYREWGWDVVQALESYCRVESGGFSGLIDVYDSDNIPDDVQQSFFLAETLKYLYLLFSDDSLISLDDWVFNTEAHPLPIKGKSPI